MSIPYAISLFILTAALTWGQADSPAPSDIDLERAIRARFAKSKIDVNKFEVRVRNGVAILEGSTDVAQHKGVATRLARRAGARRVDNKIQISERAKQKASRKQRSRPRRVYVRFPESRRR